MTTIPRSALVLGIAGITPFLWGLATLVLPEFGAAAQQALGGRFVGPYLQLAYGTVILSFMSGVLWGFATKAEGTLAMVGYSLSVIPALWAFFMIGGGPVSATINLIFGFFGLLLLDWQFWRVGLAPEWWIRLRGPLTGVVILTLIPVVL